VGFRLRCRFALQACFAGPHDAKTSAGGLLCRSSRFRDRFEGAHVAKNGMGVGMRVLEVQRPFRGCRSLASNWLIHPCPFGTSSPVNGRGEEERNNLMGMAGIYIYFMERRPMIVLASLILPERIFRMASLRDTVSGWINSSSSGLNFPLLNFVALNI